MGKFFEKIWTKILWAIFWAAIELLKDLTNTIILAALDLEEVGTHGAIAFVHDFLIKNFLYPYNFPQIQGFIVLDSIMSFNASKNSQKVGEDYLRSFPEESRKLLKEGAKGDFAAIISRENDNQLGKC